LGREFDTWFEILVVLLFPTVCVHNLTIIERLTELKKAKSIKLGVERNCIVNIFDFHLSVFRSTILV